MIKCIFAAALLVAGPAFAAAPHDTPTAQDFRDGRCTRQQVHNPAGKLVHNPPIVRCDRATTSRAAAAQSRERTPATADSIADGSAR